ATILAGMIPSLVGAAALAIAGIYAWFSLSYFLVRLPALPGFLLLAGATCLLQSGFEKQWRQGPKAGDAKEEQIDFVGVMIVITGVATGAFWAWWRTGLGDVPASLPLWLRY